MDTPIHPTITTPDGSKLTPEGGMTLHDYFTAAALQGYCSSTGRWESLESMVSQAQTIATLALRNRPKCEEPTKAPESKPSPGSIDFPAQELIDAAIFIQNHMEKKNQKFWEICGIADRRFALSRESAMKALNHERKISKAQQEALLKSAKRCNEVEELAFKLFSALTELMETNPSAGSFLRAANAITEYRDFTSKTQASLKSSQKDSPPSPTHG